MAITLTDKIQFSNITVPGKSMGGVISKSTYKSTSGSAIDDEYEGQIQLPSPLINAIDIDWNGANFSTAEAGQAPTILNTTGDLIKTIKWASTQVGSIYLRPKIVFPTFNIKPKLHRKTAASVGILRFFFSAFGK